MLQLPLACDVIAMIRIDGGAGVKENNMRYLDLLERTEKVKDCLEWQGALRAGYGCLKYKGSTVSAHRLAWELKHGKIPDNMCVCHHCDNRKCINIEHLFLGTHADNMQDAYDKGRINSPNIHRFKLGEPSTNRKLNETDLADIRERLDNGESGADIARSYYVDRNTIYRIRDGVSYR